VYATNPMTALGIMRRAQQLGLLIPRDLSLVGMDDSDVRSHVWPRMSAVCQDASSLGYEAASSLMQVLTDGRRHAVRKLLPTTFEVNGTTAPPASSAMGGATSGDGSVEMARKTRADAKAKRGRKSIEKA
jgi:LacI family transcriptional regulator